MKKKLLISVIACVILFTAVCQTALAEDIEEYTPVATYIDGEPVELQKSALLIDCTTYVPLRALSLALGATDVSWDNGTQTATVTAPGLTVTVPSEKTYIIANGRYLYLPDGIPNLDGTLMLPVRALLKAFDATVEWNGADNAIYVTRGSGAIAPADAFYNGDDLYWLSRIIYAESGNQPLIGMIAVGTVIMNRVADPRFPSSIYNVIFDFSCGVQFTPAYTGSIYNTPNESSVIAAKLVLDGAREAGESLFFASIKNCWAAYNRPYVMTIGGHDFYA